MSTRPCVVFVRALSLGGAAFLLACAAGVAPASHVREPTPAVTSTASASATSSVAPSATASNTAAPVASASAAIAHSPPADEPTPPCVDGEIVMGVCVCEKGRGADATG